MRLTIKSAAVNTYTFIRQEIGHTKEGVLFFLELGALTTYLLILIACRLFLHLLVMLVILILIGALV